MARSDSSESATITIPADYVEDARTALVLEIKLDAGALESNQAELLEGDNEVRRDNRDSSAVILREDVQLLNQLLDEPEGDSVLRGEPRTLAHVFEEMVRVLSGRLKDVCGYGPLPMGDVVELSTRLRWAADEAIRLCPELAHRLSDTEPVKA